MGFRLNLVRELRVRDLFENKNLNITEKILSLHIDEITKYPPLSDDQVKDLSARIHEGNEKAFETLVKHNLRFVIRVAKNYRNQGVPFVDLIEAGTLGLIYSARKYKYNEETKFISYAVWGIKHSIHRELASMSRSFSIPARVIPRIQELNKKIEGGETLESKDVLFYLKMLPSTSLDSPTLSGDGAEHTDYLIEQVSKDANEGEAKLDKDEITNLIIAEIERLLNDQEQVVIKDYFGFLSGEVRTMDEVGAGMRLSRERVRKIKDKALIKLRCSKVIRTYYKDNNINF